MNRSILIVDDEPHLRALIHQTLEELEDEGVELLTATNGEEALALIQSSRPALVFLDVMMPKLSGFEVAKKLKQDPATRSVMILMVTALNELGDIERAVDAGTDDFLSKPVDKIELLKRVENMLTLRHVKDEVERLRQYIAKMEDGGPGC